MSTEPRRWTVRSGDRNASWPLAEGSPLYFSDQPVPVREDRVCESDLLVVARAIHIAVATHTWDFDDCLLCPDIARAALATIFKPETADEGEVEL